MTQENGQDFKFPDSYKLVLADTHLYKCLK